MITREQMSEFSGDKLLEIFAELYAYDNGEKKVQEIVNKIETSKKMDEILQFSIRNKQLPSAAVIFNYMNTMTYFIFSKSETLCLGAMYFATLCSAKLRIFDRTGTEEFLLKNESEETALTVEIILHCNKMKAHIKQGFFDKFFRALANYEE